MSVNQPRVAVVTGGARGIGRAISIGLAERGYHLAVADLAPSTATVEAIRSTGASALAIECDVTVPSDVTRTIKAVHEEFGRCDVLVNNAAIYPRVAFDDLDLELWQRVLAVNVTSAFLFAKAVIPGMRDRGFGRIVNLSSNTVGLPVECMTHYITSKAAIIGFTQALAADVGPSGITVNCVAPGATATEGMLAGQESPAAKEQRMQLFHAMVSRQAIRRLSEPRDVANAVAWFASDEAAFVSAQVLVVDGGLTRM